MKKIIISLALLFVPLLASASLDTNLYYGVQNKSQVKELQEFLIDQGVLTGNATGNFYSLTLAAVKKYQVSVQLPKTGYVGTLTRASINTQLEANLQDSNQQAITDPAPIPVPTPIINQPVVQNQVPAPTTTSQPVVQSQPIMNQITPDFPMPDLTNDSGSNLIISVKTPFDRGVVTITDENGKVWRDHYSTWFKDQYGNPRQVVTVDPSDKNAKYTYELYFEASGYKATTLKGQFPNPIN